MDNGFKRSLEDEGTLIDLQSAKRKKYELVEFENGDKNDNQLMEVEVSNLF